MVPPASQGITADASVDVARFGGRHRRAQPGEAPIAIGVGRGQHHGRRS